MRNDCRDHLRKHVSLLIKNRSYNEPNIYTKILYLIIIAFM